MKKIYLKPEMELTECCMLKTAICSLVETGDNNKPSIPGTPAGPPVVNGAPARKVF